ncbi:hypothetical protein BKA66DRAFT_370205, partial [Pyrenochaeta sp. MPI-SDFR-AT-0127]
QPQHSLPRRRSKYLVRQKERRTRPIAIPTYASEPQATHSLAMQRWQESPPQDEGASLSAIYSALQSPPEISPPYQKGYQHDAFLTYRGPPSIKSHDSAASTSSLRSDNSKSSHSVTSSASYSVRHSKRRGRIQKPSTGVKDAGRIFKCTFCCDSFKHKYEWARHEKTIHLSVEEWQCAPLGGSITMGSTGRAHCAYCSALDPTADHLEQHNHNACRNNQPMIRSFRRKDHLIQHLRHFHGVETLPILDDWVVEPVQIVSRCGFCNASLNSWDERTDHLAAHFRNGKTMAHWRGEHGFDPAVAARVSYSLAPYLIADDSISLIPFSATNPASHDHLNQISSQVTDLACRAPEVPMLTNDLALPNSLDGFRHKVDPVTFAEILTKHLSRFARQKMSTGIIPTDEMFQRESRRIMFGDEEDNWNQTLADNEEWLHFFRQQNDLNG